MSNEAEQSILGGLMILEFSGEQADKVLHKLKPSYFKNPLNRSIFEAAVNLVQQSQGVDWVTLDAKLQNHPVYQDMGGFSYLIDLGKNTPSASNLMAYVRVVKDAAVKEFAIKKLNEALVELTDEGDVYQQIGRAESILSEINNQGLNDKTGLRHIKEFGKEWHEKLEKYHLGAPEALGMTSGVFSLDKLLKPKLIPKGSLVVVGARPKMGKTALLSLIANHSAINLGLNTPVFSLEMPGDQVFERAVTTHGKINPVSYYNETSGSVYDTLLSSSSKLVNSKLFVDDTPGLSISDIQREARILAKQGQLGFLAVDYLTLMSAEKAERNDLAYGFITKSLKNLAKELNCVVLLLTQLNRQLESRNDKRPMPSDSRDTGQIEQDCDIWIGLYRHGVYDQDCKHPSLTEGIVRLNRHGKTGSFFLDLREGYFSEIDEAEALRMKAENEPSGYVKPKSF